MNQLKATAPTGCYDLTAHNPKAPQSSTLREELLQLLDTAYAIRGASYDIEQRLVGPQPQEPNPEPDLDNVAGILQELRHVLHDARDTISSVRDRL